MSDIEEFQQSILGLDESMEGGIPQGHIVIVAGASGADEIFSYIFPIIQCRIVWGNKWHLRHVRTGKR